MGADDTPSASANRLEKWTEWLEGDLSDQVHRIMWQRMVFKSWNELVDCAAPESKSRGLFHAWVNDNYVTSLAVSVRRMCDRDTRTRSLVRLLTDVQDHPDELDVEWWTDRWWPKGEDPPETYLEQFADLSQGGDHVAPAVITADLDELADVSDVLRAYVDKYVAHIDGDRESIGSVTLGQLHAAADTVYDVFHRWYERIPNVVLSVPIAEPWEHGFTVPWITDTQATAIFGRRESELESLEFQLREMSTEDDGLRSESSTQDAPPITRRSNS